MICFEYILCFQKIVAENIFMHNKYICVPYEGRFDANIFLEKISYANIFLRWRKKKKETYVLRDIRSKFMSYISL